MESCLTSHKPIWVSKGNRVISLLLSSWMPRVAARFGGCVVEPDGRDETPAHTLVKTLTKTLYHNGFLVGALAPRVL